MSAPAGIGDLEPSLIDDPALARDGERVLEWTRLNMPLLHGLRDDFARERPLGGRRIGMCLHVEAKTAVLVEVLRAGGAELVITGSPATTDDRVAAFLAADPGICVYAKKADTMAAASGHQIQIMDLGFALQAHSLRALALDSGRFNAGYNAVPADVDSAVAHEALTTLSSVELRPLDDS